MKTTRRYRFGWLWIWRAIRIRSRQTRLLALVVAALYALGLVFPIALLALRNVMDV